MNKLKIFGISAAIIVFLAIAAFAIPLSMPNGVEKFSGVKREAAIETLEFNKRFKKLWLSSVVEAVYPRQAGSGPCVAPSSDPNDIRYYTIVVRNVTFFGLTYDVINYQGCMIKG